MHNENLSCFSDGKFKALDGINNLDNFHFCLQQICGKIKGSLNKYLGGSNERSNISGTSF